MAMLEIHQAAIPDVLTIGFDGKRSDVVVSLDAADVKGVARSTGETRG
jgi:hypothetical protein